MLNRAFRFLWRNFELLFFCSALVLLYFMQIVNNSSSFCLFKMAGITACPGCGLGHAIHLALHSQFTLSFRAHIFGVPAVIIIIYRILQLILNKNLPKHEPQPRFTNPRY